VRTHSTVAFAHASSEDTMRRRVHVKTATDSYVESLIDEWRMRNCSRRVQTCVRRVLKELSAETLLFLRRELKLEVMVLAEADYSVWAYFPVNRRRLIAQRLRPRPTTRVLLTLSEKHFQEQPLKRSGVGSTGTTPEANMTTALMICSPRFGTVANWNSVMRRSATCSMLRGLVSGLNAGARSRLPNLRRMIAIRPLKPLISISFNTAASQTDALQ